MDHRFPTVSTVRTYAGSIGYSALASFVLALLPKCPLCWLALTSALGIGSTFVTRWMLPLSVGLLLLSVFSLFIRAWRKRQYGPFLLGLLAAAAMLLFKFSLDLLPGVYFSGAVFLFATGWSVRSVRLSAGGDGEDCCTRSGGA